MKKLFGVLSVLAASLLLLPASFSCVGAGDSQIEAVLGQWFTLPVGQTAEIDSEALSITFEEVITESRCPLYSQCVSEGEATCRVLFRLAGSPAEMLLTVAGGMGALSSDYFISYKLTFKLEPHPEMGRDIAPSDYQLVITVTK